MTFAFILYFSPHLHSHQLFIIKLHINLSTHPISPFVCVLQSMKQCLSGFSDHPPATLSSSQDEEGSLRNITHSYIHTQPHRHTHTAVQHLPVWGGVLCHSHGETVRPLQLRLLPQGGQSLDTLVPAAQWDTCFALVERETQKNTELCYDETEEICENEGKE